MTAAVMASVTPASSTEAATAETAIVPSSWVIADVTSSQEKLFGVVMTERHSLKVELYSELVIL